MHRRVRTTLQTRFSSTVFMSQPLQYTQKMHEYWSTGTGVRWQEHAHLQPGCVTHIRFPRFADDRKHDRSRPWYGRDGWTTTYPVNSICVRALWREPCCNRIKHEIKGMVKLILPSFKVNASVRIIFPSAFVADGVKRLRMRSMRSRSRMWRRALLARRRM